ncbi:MAG: hypothetical protein PHU12_01855 [Candidatus Aenigmarchaeota archaeon]|nr:hypothetical protein [Candidatus Aenigmarchaeota archaeon]
MDDDDRLVNTKLNRGEIDREKFIKKYSIFFLKPTELSNYTSKDERFQYVRDGLSSLTDFSENVENAVIQQALLKRGKIFKWGKSNGLLNQNIFNELDDEIQRITEEHSEVKRTIRNLERSKNMVENSSDRDRIVSELDANNAKYDSLEKQKKDMEQERAKLKRELFPDKGPRNFSYARNVANEQRREEEYER